MQRQMIAMMVMEKGRVARAAPILWTLTMAATVLNRWFPLTQAELSQHWQWTLWAPYERIRKNKKQNLRLGRFAPTFPTESSRIRLKHRWVWLESFCLFFRSCFPLWSMNTISSQCTLMHRGTVCVPLNPMTFILCKGTDLMEKQENGQCIRPSGPRGPIW